MAQVTRDARLALYCMVNGTMVRLDTNTYPTAARSTAEADAAKMAAKGLYIELRKIEVVTTVTMLERFEAENANG